MFYCARGICAPARYDLATANKVLNNTITADEILAITKFDKRSVGIWWLRTDTDDEYTLKDIILEGEDFAKKEDDLTQGFGRDEYEGLVKGIDYLDRKVNHINVELPIVLIGIAPEGWNPDDNPPEGYGLMGNSYINRRKWKMVQLTHIRYYGGKGWKTLPCKRMVKV